MTTAVSPITKSTEISEVQRIQLDLLRLASFEGLDGEAVGQDLVAHRDFWIAFMIDREAHTSCHRIRSVYEDAEKGIYRKPGSLGIAPFDTIRLRDMADGYWNVDALFILPAPGKEKKLEEMANGWGADEIDWYDPLDASFVEIGETKIGEVVKGYVVKKMLRVWWD